MLLKAAIPPPLASPWGLCQVRLGVRILRRFARAFLVFFHVFRQNSQKDALSTVLRRFVDKFSTTPLSMRSSLPSASIDRFVLACLGIVVFAELVWFKEWRSPASRPPASKIAARAARSALDLYIYQAGIFSTTLNKNGPLFPSPHTSPHSAPFPHLYVFKFSNFRM